MLDIRGLTIPTVGMVSLAKTIFLLFFITVNLNHQKFHISYWDLGSECDISVFLVPKLPPKQLLQEGPTLPVYAQALLGGLTLSFITHSEHLIA